MTSGIHHVTAICGDPQRNVDFYVGLLGLRLFKRTVNFDAPDMYHFYYGDHAGTPGTILTFFPWPGSVHGRRGTGQAVAVAFSVPPGAIEFWARRLAEAGVDVRGPSERFDEIVLAFDDPDGLGLELVGSARGDRRAGRAVPGIDAAQAIRGVGGVTLAIDGYERTAGVLTEVLGLREDAVAGSRFRYRAGDGVDGVVDLVCLPDAPPGRVAGGTVHHVAFRAGTDEEQATTRGLLAARGQNVTPQLDRRYFRSIYFREPGGVLLELATDEPGFAVDEPSDALGGRLSLPDWLEPSRSQIERRLPPVAFPGARG